MPTKTARREYSRGTNCAWSTTRPRKTARSSSCPNYERYKDQQYRVCRQYAAEERQHAQVQQAQKQQAHKQPPLEHSNHWKNQGNGIYFVYILKLDGGRFYAGQTEDLRSRITEHRDGKTTTTRGRNPRLVWFRKADNRQEAAEDEAYLKGLVDSNEREVQHMITEFLDLVREVDTNDVPDAARDELRQQLRYRRQVPGVTNFTQRRRGEQGEQGDGGKMRDSGATRNRTQDYRDPKTSDREALR